MCCDTLVAIAAMSISLISSDRHSTFDFPAICVSLISSNSHFTFASMISSIVWLAQEEFQQKIDSGSFFIVNLRAAP